jgi:hypothetical protein
MDNFPSVYIKALTNHSLNTTTSRHPASAKNKIKILLRTNIGISLHVLRLPESALKHPLHCMKDYSAGMPLGNS